MSADRSLSYSFIGGIGSLVMALVMSVVLVFLVLAAQYESWTSPAAVISVVPLAALGVVIAVTIAAADINVYTQMGLVLLVALASKNAILIVEFASEQRRSGKSIKEAAVPDRRPIFVLLERANIRAQHLGQHWHNAIREVDRVTALSGFFVQRTAGTDIEAHIGNRDQRLVPAILVRSSPNRIVVIACIGGIDSDNRKVTQVLAPQHAE